MSQSSATAKSPQPTPSNFTTPASGRPAIIDPDGAQRHDLLWISLGVYLGICILSLIVKVSGIRRQQKQTSRKVQLEDHLRTTMVRLDELATERELEKAEFEDTIRGLRDELNVIGPIRDLTRQQEERIRSLENSNAVLEGTSIAARERQNERARHLETFQNELQDTITAASARESRIVSESERNLRERDELIRTLREGVDRLKGVEITNTGQNTKIRQLERTVAIKADQEAIIDRQKRNIKATERVLREQNKTIRILCEKTNRLENCERLSLEKDGRIAELEMTETERVQAIEELQEEVARLSHRSRESDRTVNEQQTRINNLAKEREQAQAQLDIVQEELLALLEEKCA